MSAAIDAKVAPLNAEIEQQRKDAVLLRARLEGKVVALNADALAKLSVVDLNAHVDALPVTVPLSAFTPTHVDESGTPQPLSADQLAIARNCGLDPAEIFGRKE